MAKDKLTPDQVLSFFHYPPLWLGDEAAVDKAKHTVNFTLMSQDVFRREKNLGGLKIRATRDGEFFFDFSGTNWGLIPDGLDLKVEADRAKLAEVDGLRLAAINAFLICLYSRYRDVGGWAIRHMHVRTGQTAMVMTFDSNQGSGSASYGSGLKGARNPETYRQGLAQGLDDRIADRVNVIEGATLELACDNLDQILKLNFEEGAVRIALCSASVDKLKDNEFETSLVLSWAVIESIIAQQWVIHNNSGVTPSSYPKVFDMTKELKDAGKFTVAENDQIDKIRRARNGWLHKFLPVGEAAARDGLTLALDLFNKFFGIQLGVNAWGSYRITSHKP